MPHFHTAPNAVSVVVGASRGLGLALSAALLQRSTGRVVALARQPEEAPALMALREASGGRMSCFSCDVTDYESLRTMAEHVKSEHEQVDLLLNVTGEPVELLNIFSFTLPGSIHDSWAAGVYPLSLLIALLSGLWPYVKLLLMLTCWWA